MRLGFINKLMMKMKWKELCFQTENDDNDTSTATFFLLHCDEWDRVVALPRHKFVTGATLLQLISVLSYILLTSGYPMGLVFSWIVLCICALFLLIGVSLSSFSVWKHNSFHFVFIISLLIKPNLICKSNLCYGVWILVIVVS
jgi:hypothetical protein